MIILGLTGSIGMGKSTTARLFAEAGIPVHDADQAVHNLYRGEAVAAVSAAFPGAVKDGEVNRQELGRQLAQNPAQFKVLEAIVHPLVRQKEAEFLEHSRSAGYPLVLLDIPLLFESGAEGRVDKVAVVSCDPNIQRARVLARPGMTVDKFELILSRQTPDAEKRRRADYVIETGNGIEPARQKVAEIIQALSAKGHQDA